MATSLAVRTTSTQHREAVGASESFLQFQERLSRAARVDRPVLLVGERGTGKELAAAKLHYLSPRWQGPFVALNCAALVATLLESELFGHEQGAFTGATQRRTGRFEAANGGTLFLDEIGQIPLEVQEKVLRTVEYGTFERVGSSQPVQVETRIVAATNADLPRLAEQGRFKHDLLDRLSFEVLFVPPLRERREDVMLLVHHFAARMAHELGWAELPVFTPDAIRKLEKYAWPGNVRELKNVVERAVYRSEDRQIDEIDFDPFVSPYGPPSNEEGGPSRKVPVSEPDGFPTHGVSLVRAVQELEIRLLRESLEESRYNQRKAAQRLGLTYHQLRGLLRKYREQLP